MRRLLVTLFLLCAFPVFGQVSTPPRITLQDEGAAQGTVRILNCTGAGITCSVSGVTGTLNAAGGSGSANTVEVSIDLGTSMGLVFTATVTGQAWVTTSSEIVCAPFATSADGQTVETYFVAGLQAVASNRVASTGFDLSLFSPYGATGTFRVHCTGA